MVSLDYKGRKQLIGFGPTSDRHVFDLRGKLSRIGNVIIQFNPIFVSLHGTCTFNAMNEYIWTLKINEGLLGDFGSQFRGSGGHSGIDKRGEDQDDADNRCNELKKTPEGRALCSIGGAYTLAKTGFTYVFGVFAIWAVFDRWGARRIGLDPIGLRSVLICCGALAAIYVVCCFIVLCVAR
jgi:hypothetical protein